MAHQTTGFNAETWKRLVVGPGAVYLDYGLASERLLGATRGGNTFEPGVTIRQVEVDGVKGKVRGGQIIDRVEPVLRCNMLEFSVANLRAAIPGLTETLVAGTARGETYELNVGAGTGTFRLVRGAHQTAALAHNAPATDVQRELERLYDIGDVVVSRTGAVYTITFAVAARGGQGLTADLTLLSGATFTMTQAYDPGDSYTRLTLSEIDAGAYFTNCALVGRVTGSNKPVVVIVNNVLAAGGFAMAFVPAGEMVSELVLEGHFDAPGAGEFAPPFPFEIRWPPEA